MFNKRTLPKLPKLKLNIFKSKFICFPNEFTNKKKDFLKRSFEDNLIKILKSLKLIAQTLNAIHIVYFKIV